MIDEKTRIAIKGYLEGFIQGLLEQQVLYLNNADKSG